MNVIWEVRLQRFEEALKEDVRKFFEQIPHIGDTIVISPLSYRVIRVRFLYKPDKGKEGLIFEVAFGQDVFTDEGMLEHSKKWIQKLYEAESEKKS